MLRRPWTSSFSCVNAVALTAISCRRSARRVAVTTISSRPPVLVAVAIGPEGITGNGTVPARDTDDGKRRAYPNRPSTLPIR
jgi:hypothetical protein